jgi:HEAT repeat protein
MRDWGLAGLALIAVLAGSSVAVEAQKYTFEEVASGLTHTDAATRLRAIQILKDADYPEAVVPIAAALGDKEDRVQLAAIDAERSLFTTRPVARRRKIGFVIETRSTAGGEAVDGLLALKPRAIPSEVLQGLAVALRDNNPQVRAAAINLSTLLGPVACAGRAIAAGACADIGNALIQNLNSREAPVRRAAMQALGQLRYPNAVQALADRYSYHQRGLDALTALEGLAGLGDRTSVSLFTELVTNSNSDVRRLAVEGLGRARATEVLPEMQRVGQTERSGGVLLAIHFAHAKMRAPGGSLQELVGALRTPSLRPAALKYLLELSPEVPTELAASLGDESADVRRLVADVLGFSGNAEIVPSLQAAARDADPDVAQAAQQAIERLKALAPARTASGG